jgi:hypothetical protein
MNCEWAKANVALYIYEELPDDERHEFEQHASRCQECAAELKQMRSFQMDMSALPTVEPSANLLAASRMRLQEALETTEQSRWRFTFDPSAWLRQARFSPALAAVILMVGFAGGIGTAYRLVGPSNGQPRQISPEAAQASIAGIRAINPAQEGNKVSIVYDTMQQESVEGSLDDPRIQQLLLFAARSNYNSGLRMDSIDLLTRNPEGTKVREALMYALRYDKNPGVRLKALDGLREHVKEDIRVRDAVLQALLEDENPGVRSEAISMLRAVSADGSVRQALEVLSREDRDQYIRQESRRVLASMPEIE